MCRILLCSQTSKALIRCKCRYYRSGCLDIQHVNKVVFSGRVVINGNVVIKHIGLIGVSDNSLLWVQVTLFSAWLFPQYFPEKGSAIFLVRWFAETKVSIGRFFCFQVFILTRLSPWIKTFHFSPILNTA